MSNGKRDLSFDDEGKIDSHRPCGETSPPSGEQPSHPPNSEQPSCSLSGEQPCRPPSGEQSLSQSQATPSTSTTIHQLTRTSGAQHELLARELVNGVLNVVSLEEEMLSVQQEILSEVRRNGDTLREIASTLSDVSTHYMTRENEM